MSRWNREFSTGPVIPFEEEVCLEYQKELLKTLNEMKPEILKELKNDISPNLELSNKHFMQPTKRIPEKTKVILKAWSEKHKLNHFGRYAEGAWRYDWLIEAEVNTIIRWQKGWTECEWYLYGLYEGINPLKCEPLNEFLYREAQGNDFDVNLFRGTKASERKRLEYKIKGLLYKYIESIMDHDHDCVKKLQKKRKQDHFKWLILYQLDGWTKNEIALAYSTEDRTLGEDTINKAISEVANSAGITLRSEK